MSWWDPITFDNTDFTDDFCNKYLGDDLNYLKDKVDAYDAHKVATTLDHPDGSVKAAKIPDGEITDAKLAIAKLPLTADYDSGWVSNVDGTINHGMGARPRLIFAYESNAADGANFRCADIFAGIDISNVNAVSYQVTTGASKLAYRRILMWV